MTFSLGIFDLFSYMIPGSLYLAFLSYLGARLGLVDLESVNHVPTALLLVAVAIASYLLGHLAYTPSLLVDQLTPRRLRRKGRAKEIFLARVPEAAHRPYVHADRTLLITSAQLHDRESAIEITRLRAVGLMVRNACIPLLLGFAASVAEIAVGTNRPLAAGCAVLFLAAALGTVRQNQTLREWSDIKAFEICFWIPEIDEKIRLAQEGQAAHELATAAPKSPALSG